MSRRCAALSRMPPTEPSPGPSNSGSSPASLGEPAPVATKGSALQVPLADVPGEERGAVRREAGLGRQTAEAGRRRDLRELVEERQQRQVRREDREELPFEIQAYAVVEGRQGALAEVVPRGAGVATTIR